MISMIFGAIWLALSINIGRRCVNDDVRKSQGQPFTCVLLPAQQKFGVSKDSAESSDGIKRASDVDNAATVCKTACGSEPRKRSPLHQQSCSVVTPR